MPYLQISLGNEVSQAEGKSILQDLRDNFPLRQSEGHFYRMSSRYILFEQPEHNKLTLEQELWLEQRRFTVYVSRFPSAFRDKCTISFHNDIKEGCRNCNSPFDESPENYFAQCAHNNPLHLTGQRLTISENEHHYLKMLVTELWHNSYHLHIHCTALALTEVIERISTRDARKHLMATNRFADSITENKEVLYCLIYNYLPVEYQHENSLVSEKSSSPTIYANFTKSEYQNICTAAASCELTPAEFIRHSFGIPEAQMAWASAEAASGHLFSCDLTFFLSFFAKEITEALPSVKPAIKSVTATDGQSIPIDIFHLVLHTTKLAQAFPLLSDTIISILIGLSRKQPEQSYLTWEKGQLTAMDQAASSSAHPCTEKEIVQLEEVVEHVLPEAYKEFLAWMGYGAGNFMQYLNCFYPSLLSFQHIAPALLKADHSPALLPTDAFVFYMKINQCFAFFRTSEGDDPPIYAHRRDWRRQPFRIIYHHFSDFLAVQLGIYENFLSIGEAYPLSLFQRDSLREDFLTTVPKVREAIQQKFSEQL